MLSALCDYFINIDKLNLSGQATCIIKSQYHSQINHKTETIGSTSIRHRSYISSSDRYLIEVDPGVFVIWDFL